MKNWSKISAYLVTALAVTLAGCAYSTRENSTAFAVKQSGQIAKENVNLFSDCMLDGLNPLSGKILNSRTVRQQTRSSFIRIDTMASNGQMHTTSTDIQTNGDVQFLVNTNTSMALVTMSDESEVFSKCLTTYRLRK